MNHPFPAQVNVGAGVVAVTSDAFFIATSWELVFLGAGAALVLFAAFRKRCPATAAGVERRCAPLERAYARLHDKVFHRDAVAAAPAAPPETSEEWQAFLHSMKHERRASDVEMEVFRDPLEQADLDDDVRVRVGDATVTNFRKDAPSTKG